MGKGDTAVGWQESLLSALRIMNVRARALMDAHAQAILILLVLLCAVVGAVVLYHTDNSSFLYFGDAVSHLTRARLYVDSRHPGLYNIGTVWLPLPHMIYILPAMIDACFYSGIAGPLIGIPCLTATTWMLYSVNARLTGSKPIAFVCALLFGLNPNMVYMALTPMTEPLLLFFVTVAAHRLLAWIDADRERDLLLAAGAVVCASLCRYEAWLCVPFVSLLALKKAQMLGAMNLRRRAVLAASAGAWVWAGVIFWLVWNKAEFGDALKFMHWNPALQSNPGSVGVAENPLGIIRLVGTAIRAVFGPMVLIVAGAAVVRHLRVGLGQRALLVIVFLALPGCFMLVSIAMGFAEVDQWRWNWRYMLTLGLFLAAAGAVGLQELFGVVRGTVARAAIVLGALAIPVIQISMPSVGVSTYIDAKKGFIEEIKSAQHAGELLGRSDVSASVALVTGFGQSQRIMISSGLPLKTFRIVLSLDDAALLEPLWPDAQYVVIGKNTRPESRRLVEYWLTRRAQLLARYAMVDEDDYYLILRLIPSRNSYREQDPARR